MNLVPIRGFQICECGKAYVVTYSQFIELIKNRMLTDYAEHIFETDSRKNEVIATKYAFINALLKVIEKHKDIYQNSTIRRQSIIHAVRTHENNLKFLKGYKEKYFEFLVLIGLPQQTDN